MKLESYQTQEPAGPASTIDFRELSRVMMEKWWLLVPVALLSGALGYFYMEQRPPAYNAKAVLEVQTEDPKVFGIEDVAYRDLRANEVLNTIVANVKNSAVLRRVILTNNLLTDPVFLQDAPPPRTEAAVMKALDLMVSCHLRKDTRLIEIKVTHSNPAMAQQLVNSMGEEYIRQILEQRFSTANLANALLSEEAAKLKAKLTASEKELQEYKQKKQAVSLEERQNIITDKLKEFNKSYTDAKAIRLRLGSDLQQIQQNANRVDALLTMPIVLQDATIADLRQKVITLEAQAETLAQRYKPKHPRMSQLQRELQDLRDSLSKAVLEYPRLVQAAYEVALGREKQLENALQQAKQEALDLDQDAIQYNALMRDLQSDRALYDSVLKRLKEMDLTKGWHRQIIAFAEPAGLPSKPAGPSKKLFAGLGGMFGFVSILGLLYLLRMKGGRILAVDQAEEILGLPVVAAIPRTRRARGAKPRMVLTAEPDSPGAEAFRSLRTAAYLAAGEKNKRIVLFTSAVPQEGKTFCSVNFALSLAREGHRILLLDLDLRRPAVAESFCIPSEQPGLAEYVSGEGTLLELVQATEYDNLFVLPAGTPILPEALSAEVLHKLLREAGQHFDQIVMDSAPINAVSDTLLLLHSAHLTYLVIRAGKTRRRAVLRALEIMRRAQHPPLGVVLNFLPPRAGPGDYYHYAQAYGYKRKRRPKGRIPAAVEAVTETVAVAESK